MNPPPAMMKHVWNESQKQNKFSQKHKLGLSLCKRYFLCISHMKNPVVQHLDSWRFTSSGLSVSQLHVYNMLSLMIEMGAQQSFHFQIS
jgi:hypothetical protein